MLQAFGSLKSIVRSNWRCSESLVFYLHYRLTCLSILFCCMCISTQQFVSSKIQCLSKPFPEINPEVLNNYCWASATYSVTSAYLKEVGVDIPHSGIEASEKKSEYVYRNFYQYVHIALFIQAVMFYAPHILWKSFERNSISSLPEQINCLKTSQESNGKTYEASLDVVAISIEERWGCRKALVLKYLMCEILAATNVLVQSYMLDVFFHGKFLNLGLLIEVYYHNEIFSDPLQLFPIVTVCHFQRYGPSGFIDQIDALCVLPVNAINGKIFLGIWLWFAILIFLSFGSIMHLILSILFPAYRVWQLKFYSFLNMGRISYDSLIDLAQYADFGDWFVISSIKKNVDEINFCRLTEKILSRINSLETEVKEP